MLEFFPDQRDLILEQSLQGKLSDIFRDTKHASWQEIFLFGSKGRHSKPM